MDNDHEDSLVTILVIKIPVFFVGALAGTAIVWLSLQWVPTDLIQAIVDLKSATAE